MTGISVNKEDTPELGGMIAVNPANNEDRWYVAKQFFETNYVEVKDAERTISLPNGLGEEAKILHGLPTSPYTWDGEFWKFYTKSWGGWMKLRIGTKTASRPMTFLEGVRHIHRMYGACLT